MTIDTKLVRKVARLARLKVPAEREEALVGELNTIMGWIGQLQEVDVDGVEPMTSAVVDSAPMRADVVTDGGKVDDVLANAPKAADGFFIVPKVVE